MCRGEQFKHIGVVQGFGWGGCAFLDSWAVGPDHRVYATSNVIVLKLYANSNEFPALAQ